MAGGGGSRFAGGVVVSSGWAMTPGVMTSALPIPTRLSSTRMRMVIPPLSQRGAWAMPKVEPENRLGTATYRGRIWGREAP